MTATLYAQVRGSTLVAGPWTNIADVPKKVWRPDGFVWTAEARFVEHGGEVIALTGPDKPTAQPWHASVPTPVIACEDDEWDFTGWTDPGGDEQAYLDALAEAEANAPRLVQPDDFVALFTATETANILASSNGGVKRHILMLQTRSSPINLKSPTLAGKLDGLVSLSLITSDRKAAILAGEAP